MRLTPRNRSDFHDAVPFGQQRQCHLSAPFANPANDGMALPAFESPDVYLVSRSEHEALCGSVNDGCWSQKSGGLKQW